MAPKVLSTFYKTGESHDEIGASEDRDKLHQISRFLDKNDLEMAITL